MLERNPRRETDKPATGGLKDLVTDKIKERLNIGNAREMLKTLDEKNDFILSNEIETFEKWNEKSFKEKVFILDGAGGLIFEKPEFLRDRYEYLKKRNLTEELKKMELEINRQYDLFLRVLETPGYKEQQQALYPEETTPIETEPRKDSDFPDIYFKYSEHYYPEEILDLDPEVINFLKIEDKGEEGVEFELPKILKSYGFKKLSDWYSKSTEEKIKILNEKYFSGFKEIINKKSPIMTDKAYQKYLDSSFLSTIRTSSMFLLATNRHIYGYNKAHENQEKIVEREKEKYNDYVNKTMQDMKDQEEKETKEKIKNFMEEIKNFGKKENL